MASQKPISSFFQAPKRLKVTEATAKEVDPNNDSSTVAKVNDDDSVGKVLVTEVSKTNAVPHEEQTEAGTEVPELKDGSGSQETGLPDVSQEQKIRMELNKSIARAKRNLKVCEEHVASVKGVLAKTLKHCFYGPCISHPPIMVEDILCGTFSILTSI